MSKKNDYSAKIKWASNLLYYDVKSLKSFDNIS